MRIDGRHNGVGAEEERHHLRRRIRIADDIRGIEHQMNPLISGVLGIYHLETGLTELKSLHIIGGSLDLLSAGLSLAIVGLNALPGGSLLIPPTSVLAATTATVNTIGQGLLHW